jgi:hypothetical protein
MLLNFTWKTIIDKYFSNSKVQEERKKETILTNNKIRSIKLKRTSSNNVNVGVPKASPEKGKLTKQRGKP